MKQMWRKTLSLFVAVVMIVSVLPIYQANAAIEYFHFDSFSTDKNSPTQVNSGTIEVSGTYNGVASNTISYKVEQIVEDKVVAEKNGTGVNPILEGPSGFRFSNVEIFAGFNKITVFGNASGNSVSAIAYVYYPNVPTIYDIKLADDRSLQAGKPTIVSTPTVTLMLKAPNANNVTVQGKAALSGGGDTFLVSDIPLEQGLNTLVITASNTTMTYSITRDVVFYNAIPTAYGVKLTGGSPTVKDTSLEGNPTVGPNNGTALNGTISGFLAVEINPADPPGTVPTGLTVDVVDNTNAHVTGSSSTATASFVENVSVTGATYSFAVYKFTAANTFNINVTKDYYLYVKGNYGSESINYPLSFTYRSGNSPIIKEVSQLYNVTEPSSGNTVTYTSSSLFSSNLVFFQAPIWISVKADNFNPATAGHIAELTTTQGGVPIGSPAFTYVKADTTTGGNYYRNTNGDLVFKITNLPAGEQTLNITLKQGSETDVKQIPITFIPTPFIQLTNTYNTKTYKTSAEFTSIQGILTNFNLGAGSPDLNSVTITINGTTKPLTPAMINTTTGAFNYPISDPAQNLVDGPNSIIISGTASGVPVSTNITVYLFSDILPQVMTLKPVPVGSTTDPSNKFTASGTTLAYTTNEKLMDVIFSVKNADDLVVSVDGEQYTKTVAGTLTPEDARMTSLGTVLGETTFRLNSVSLPTTGMKSITVETRKGTARGSKTLQVTRVRVPYSILSPKLPEERVINQNFLKISIQAEGADQIMIGKQEMLKGSDDIFRLTVDKLKNGTNTFKFTIVTGETENTGQFSVTYATQSEVGAQYKAPMPTSGKLDVFNKELSLAFPKGTMLKNPENKNLSNTPEIDLFNNQQLLFGIADPNDGRTVKRYNRVGEMVGNIPQDGTMSDITPIAFASNILQGSRGHFGYASKLYWVDAGYFVGGSSYETTDGMQPYEKDNQFYVRGQNPAKWMVPTQRGTITLKYDSNIRNETAKNLSIWYFSNNVWRNMGGVINTSAKTVTAPFDGFGYYAVMSVRYGFEDITGHGYARNHLDSMYAKGIMEPKTSNLFGVYDNITRGEFATMIVRMLDLPLNYDTNQSQLTFSDVPPFNLPGALWDYRYIETAARAGIISGLGPRTFNPGGFLTREQAAVMIARALNIKTGDPDKDLTALAKSFADAGSIDYYAVSHVLAITKAKIMNGSPNPLEEGQKKPTFSFNPKSNLNRADMAIIAYNVMKRLKKIN